MKAKNTLVVIFGVASSAILAQSSPPQMPSGAQSQYPSGTQTQPQAQPGTQSQVPSSGESGQSQSGASSSGETATQSSTPSYDQGPAPIAAPPAPMTQLEPKTENGFTYLCGGVGATEVALMKKTARDYDMMLTFSTRKGNYLADVNVDIKDAKGKSELQTSCGGPIMLVDFPKSGTYRIRAETGGYTLNKTAHVQAKGRSHASLVLSWPQQVAEAVAPTSPTSTGSSGGNNSSNSDTGTRQ